MEGVCFAFRDCLEALKEAGTTLERATAVGGGSRSAYWLKLMATVLGIPSRGAGGGRFRRRLRRGAAWPDGRGRRRPGGNLRAARHIEAVHEPDRNLEPALWRRPCALPRALSSHQGS
jgi:xylulokinase